MKIVYIDDFFHPEAGYQDNVLSKCFVRLGHEVIIMTSELERMPTELTVFFGKDNISYKDDIFEEKYGVRIVRCPIYNYRSGRSIYKKKIFSLIEKEEPNVVFVNGNDSLIGIQLILRQKGNRKYALVTDSHMLEMASENPLRKVFRHFYRQFITPIIKEEKIFVIRTQDDEYVRKNLGVPVELSPWISFGTDTNLFFRDKIKRKRKRTEYGIKDNDFVVMYAGKLTKSKGANLLADSIQKKLITHKKNIVFFIIGNSEGTYGEIIENEFKKSENQIIRLPTQKYEELRDYYQVADLALFPKQCSLSFFDVQACGLPALFEDNNINVDRSQCGNAFTFKSDSVESLRKNILEIANLNEEEYTRISDNAIKYINRNYKSEDKAKEYITYFEKAIEKKILKNRRNSI